MTDIILLLLMALPAGAAIYAARKLFRRRPDTPAKPNIRVARKTFIHRK